MNTDEAFNVTEALSGYWPTPAMEPAEVKAWVMELTGSANITPREAALLIRLEAENGTEWRMRPGQIVALVQAHRRQEVLRRPPAPLPAGDYCTTEQNTTHIEEIRSRFSLSTKRHRHGDPKRLGSSLVDALAGMES